MKRLAKPKGKTKSVPFDPIFFAASVPARKPTDKDLKDVQEHENDPIEPKEHDAMDDTVIYIRHVLTHREYDAGKWKN